MRTFRILAGIAALLAWGSFCVYGVAHLHARDKAVKYCILASDYTDMNIAKCFSDNGLAIPKDL